MEDFLPLIIGVLWLAYTYYSKSQKKKSRERSPNTDKKKPAPSFFEQFLASEGIRVNSPEPVDYEDEEEYEPYVEKVVEKPPVMERTSAFMNTEFSDYEDEGQAQFKEAFRIDDEEGDSGDESHVSPEQLKDEFDLRKAVVFSAILEAPYIDFK